LSARLPRKWLLAVADHRLVVRGPSAGPDIADGSAEPAGSASHAGARHRHGYSRKGAHCCLSFSLSLAVATANYVEFTSNLQLAPNCL